MDNLNIHKHPMILDMIRDTNHDIVFRAPYCSCNGAIAYVFNTLEVKLQVCVRDVSPVADLILELDTILFGGNFGRCNWLEICPTKGSIVQNKE